MKNVPYVFNGAQFFIKNIPLLSTIKESCLNARLNLIGIKILLDTSLKTENLSLMTISKCGVALKIYRNAKTVMFVHCVCVNIVRTSITLIVKSKNKCR